MLSHISFMRLLSTPLPPSRDNDKVNENVSIGFDAKIGMSLQSKSPLHWQNFVSVLCNGNLHLGTIHIYFYIYYYALVRKHLEIRHFYLLSVLKLCLHSG